MLSRKLVILGILVTACCGAAFVGCNSSSNSITTPVVNEQPIPIPDGLGATADVSNNVTLHWNASTSSQVVGYNVYVYAPAVTSVNAYRKLNPAVVASSQFSIDDLNFGGDFVVCAVNSFGHEGGISRSIHLSASIPEDQVIDVRKKRSRS